MTVNSLHYPKTCLLQWYHKMRPCALVVSCDMWLSTLVVSHLTWLIAGSAIRCDWFSTTLPLPQKCLKINQITIPFGSEWNLWKILLYVDQTMYRIALFSTGNRHLKQFVHAEVAIAQGGEMIAQSSSFLVGWCCNVGLHGNWAWWGTSTYWPLLFTYFDLFRSWILL